MEVSCCSVDEPDLVRLERLHGTSASSNLADPTLRTSSNLSTVMQHWNPIAQEACPFMPALLACLAPAVCWDTAFLLLASLAAVVC